MAKQNITDRWLKAKATSAGDYWDAGFPGLGCRVAPTGRKTFVLAMRYSKGAAPTRRSLGTYPKITLADAREKAREWVSLVRAGKDPAIEEERQRAEEQEKRDSTFAAVAEDFIRDKLPGERSGRFVERELRRDLIPKLGKRPLAEITDTEIRAVIREKMRTAKVSARNNLSLVKRIFSWAIETGAYDITDNPCRNIKPKKFLGKKNKRRHTLNHDELRALWRAAERLPYPYGAAYRLLLLVPLRLNEVAEASRAEFGKSEWTIPAERMKATNEDAREHVVPITMEIAEVLAELPRLSEGDHLFSTDGGATPVRLGDKVKKKIDARMLRTLKALARARGNDPAKVTLRHWVNHDVRRTIRSELAGLRIPEVASEALLAHVQPGMQDTYNQHTYLKEKREALETWADKLRSIVNPPLQPEGNVVAWRTVTRQKLTSG